MNSYQFISALFKNILSASASIGGRFHICPKYGVEINFDQLGEVIQDAVTATVGNKYPLALLMPPRSIGIYGTQDEWESYRIVMFFLKTTYYQDGMISGLNTVTQTSTQPVTVDWESMRLAAVDFLKAIGKIQKSKNLINTTFRLDSGNKIIDPISNVGVDRASGVRLEFAITLYNGCEELQDYPADLSSIQIPNT